MADQNNGNNVVPLSKGRKRKEESKRAGGSARAQGNGHADGYERAMRNQKGRGRVSVGNVRWFHYVQVLLLLGLVAWLMKSCQM